MTALAWLALALLGALTFMVGLSVNSPLICLLSKPLPILALLGWMRRFPSGAYRRWITVGLLFSLLGDVLLAWPADLFVFGLAAFLFAHLAYLRAYLSDCRRLALLALLLSISVGGVLLTVLTQKGLGELLVPVSVYALAISAMLWRALARLNSDVTRHSARLAAAGALLFVLSDSLIGINRFVLPFDAAPYLIILSYWLGQWGITASANTKRESCGSWLACDGVGTSNIPGA